MAMVLRSILDVRLIYDVERQIVNRIALAFSDYPE